MRNTSALALQEPGKLTKDQEQFVHLIVREHKSIKDAATAVGYSVKTGYVWSRKPEIIAAIREMLAENQTNNQLEATNRLEKAWRTIERAYSNPNTTPTMLKAAIFTIMQANGASKTEAEKGVTFHLEVNTQMNMNALAEQQARHASQPALTYEGGFTVIEDE